MDEKFPIVQKIDTVRLNNMIDKYRYFNSETNPYLFMSIHTFDVISASSIDDITFDMNQSRAIANGITGYYHGYKIFRDDTLGFGEIEVR